MEWWKLLLCLIYALKLCMCSVCSSKAQTFEIQCFEMRRIPDEILNYSENSRDFGIIFRDIEINVVWQCFLLFTQINMLRHFDSTDWNTFSWFSASLFEQNKSCRKRMSHHIFLRNIKFGADFLIISLTSFRGALWFFGALPSITWYFKPFQRSFGTGDWFAWLWRQSVRLVNREMVRENQTHKNAHKNKW